MRADVNKIRNSVFSLGRAIPTGWGWEGDRGRSRWRRARGDSAESAVMTVEVTRPPGTAVWRQTVPCKPGEFYRVEAEFTCDLEGDGVRRGERSGFILTVRPFSGEPKPRNHRADSSRESQRTPGVRKASNPTIVRAYFEAPEGVRRIEICVGIVDAVGAASIHVVRMMHILEPDEVSHPLAFPPPPVSLSVPRSVERIMICSKSVETRPLTSRMRACFGARKVMTVSPEEFLADVEPTAALILPDAVPPPAVKTLKALFSLASTRTVIVSLPAFAQWAKSGVRLRRVEQPDDPMHAKVHFSNEYTCGFALADNFPFACTGKRPGWFAQNHFWKTPQLKSFLKRHGMEVLLVSMAAHDAMSERPMVLFKRFERGALFVCDVEPAEGSGWMGGEPVAGMYFLLNLLGRRQTGLGQFSSPFRREAGFREAIRELGRRVAPFVVHDGDVPTEEVKEQLVTIGREDMTYGLPLAKRPLILVRTGLESGDVESVYGAWVWFKQLVRMPPHECPYANELASRFRLGWMPHAASWEWGDGFLRTRKPPARTVELDLESGQIAALIDVESRPRNEARVVVPDFEGDHAGLFRWLPLLWRAFPCATPFTWAPPEGADFEDRDLFSWRHNQLTPKIIADPRAFSGIHDAVRQAGGKVVRLEVPGCDHDFAVQSIHRTDLVATLLEHVIGLQYGLIAVNRGAGPAVFDAMPPVASGAALVVDPSDDGFQAVSETAG